MLPNSLMTKTQICPQESNHKTADQTCPQHSTDTQHTWCSRRRKHTCSKGMFIGSVAPWNVCLLPGMTWSSRPASGLLTHYILCYCPDKRPFKYCHCILQEFKKKKIRGAGSRSADRLSCLVRCSVRLGHGGKANLVTGSTRPKGFPNMTQESKP